MLEIKNLTKRYGNSQVKAVDNLSLSLRPGEVFGFLGPNGAGKSTTIKSLVGIYPFQEGDILIDDYPSNIRAWEKAGGIGILHTDAQSTIQQLQTILSEK